MLSSRPQNVILRKAILRFRFEQWFTSPLDPAFFTLKNVLVICMFSDLLSRSSSNTNKHSQLLHVRLYNHNNTLTTPHTQSTIMAIDPQNFKQRHPKLYVRPTNRFMHQAQIAGIIVGGTIGFLCAYYPKPPAQGSVEVAGNLGSESKMDIARTFGLWPIGRK
jgi:hypothetical protein